MYVRLRSAYWTTAEGRKYCLDNFFNASLKLKYSKLNFRIIGAKLRSLKMISAGGSLEISLKNPIVESILCIISRLVLLSQINLDDTTSRTFILNLTIKTKFVCAYRILDVKNILFCQVFSRASISYFKKVGLRFLDNS